LVAIKTFVSGSVRVVFLVLMFFVCGCIRFIRVSW
jgi:hypothetical protein